MKLLQKIKQLVCMIIFRIIPVKQNRILFMSYYGKHTNCNPYAIYQEIKKRKLNFECIWVDNSHKINKNAVSFRSIAFYYYLRTSKFLIFNARPNIDIMKRKNQFYIQTWHSSLGFKMIEKDAEDTLDPKYIKKAKKDSRYIDLLVSGCRFRTECFRRNFWYNGKIAEIGTPRNDILFSMSSSVIVAEVKKELGIEEDEKIITFAPTFRDGEDLSYITSLDTNALLDIVQRKLGGRWRFVYRLHPNVAYDNNVSSGTINASRYNDMQALLLATDILITDYSSVMFDFMLLNKPCFLYCPDYDVYVKNERKSYFTIKELPFSVSKSNIELQCVISGFDHGEYMEKLNKFKIHIGTFETGQASRKILEWIDGQ